MDCRVYSTISRLCILRSFCRILFLMITTLKDVLQTLDKKMKRKSPDSPTHCHKPVKKKNGDDGSSKIKWNTLEYHGPLFPPKFEPLPVTMRYEGQRIKLKPTTAEYVVSYIKNRDKAENQKVYDENFWEDWKKVMEANERKCIRDFKKCNFTPIKVHLERTGYFKTEKKKLNKLKNGMRTCKIDGFEEKIQNPMVELPGVFIGKGDHPLNGRIKPRIVPEMVTVNCSEDTECRPPTGKSFKGIQHDNEVLYLAFWYDEHLQKRKYIQLKASSSQKVSGDVKCQRDRKKFQIARNLHKEIPLLLRCCRKNLRDLPSTENVSIQKYLALYLLIKFALRPGYPKKSGLSAETKGLCTLTLSNLKLSTDGESYWATLTFLGKSSVPFQSKKKIPVEVYQKLRECRRWKGKDDKVFDLVKAPTLNKFFKDSCIFPLSKKASLKTIRTYFAGKMFERKLEDLRKADERSMIREYSIALQKVSKMLNHTADNTAKINYIDPRITVAWCRKYKIPIKDVFTPFQREKFQWAIKKKYRDFKFIRQKN